jgi:citrate synthase
MYTDPDNAMTQFHSAREAAQRLGVSVATLYSYVSRGKLTAQPGPTPRERRYRAEEVEHLAGQLAAARSPTAATRRSLDFGRPVVESGLTLIDAGKLYYRGHSATELALEHSLEAIAALLWECDERLAFPVTGAARPLRAVKSRPSRKIDASDILQRFATERPPAQPGENSSTVSDSGALRGGLVRQLAGVLLRRSPGKAPIHLQCARAWGLSRAHSEWIRMALVLCADHELNASTFTVRCVSSTQADLRVALIAGLAALSGPLHGGATDRVEAMLDTVSHSRRLEPALRALLQAPSRLPGFGHLLYPEGDVRAAFLLDRLKAPPSRLWRRVSAIGEALTGEKPSVDFALVALRRELGLPRGAAFGLFALGRSVGWIAHALEQRASGQLIRPRAAYVGPRPGEET